MSTNVVGPLGLKMLILKQLMLNQGIQEMQNLVVLLQLVQIKPSSLALMVKDNREEVLLIAIQLAVGVFGVLVIVVQLMFTSMTDY